MVVLGPAPGGWRWQPWCSVEIYVLMALHRWENSFCLAAFNVVTALFFSYMNTTNCSVFSNAFCDRFAFSIPTSKKANATVGNAVHVFQALSFCRIMRPYHNQLQCERQAKLLICLNQDLKQSRRLQCILNVFQSQMQPTALPPLFLQQQRLQVQQRQCQQFVLSSSVAWRNTGVLASSWVHPLTWLRSVSVGDETTLSPQVETSILRETGVLSFYFFIVLLLFFERKQNRSPLFSSFFKKLFQVEGNGAKGISTNTLDVDLGPICFLSRPSSCLWDKCPKQYPTVEHSEDVQKYKAKRHCCCSPGKCLMS